MTVEVGPTKPESTFASGPSPTYGTARRRTAVLLIWALLMAACVGQILRTNFTADLSAFLPAQPDAQQRVLIEQLQSGLPARTLLLAIEGGDAKQRAAASRALAQALRQGGYFEQVHNGEAAAFESVGRWLFDHRYALSPAVDAQRFTAAGLADAISETLSLLGTPAGSAIKPILERDPTGETVRIAEALIPATAPRSEEGVWVSREIAQQTAGPGAPQVGQATPQVQRALLVAISKAAGADLDGQAAAIAHTQQAFGKLQLPGLTLKMSGAPVFGVDSRAQIEREVHWLAIAGTVLMSALLLVAFASLPALLVALLPVATGVLVGVAAVSLVFGGVHGITLAFGTTLIGEAVDYAIYYLIQARRGGAAQWLRTGWPTVRLGLWTSLCGFAALVFSGFPGLAQLGVFSVAGLAGAALFTRLALPQLMPHGAHGVGLRRLLGRVAARAVAVLPRLRWPLVVLGVAAVVLLLQRGDLWRAELSSLSPIRPEALALDAALRADLSAGDARTLVVVQGADLQAALRQAEAAAGVLDTLTDAGRIGGYDSVTRWLPSDGVQAQRRAALPERSALGTALAQATRGGPLSAARLAPFVDEVQAARQQPPVTLPGLRSAGLSVLIDALLLQRADGSTVALLPVQPSAPATGSDTTPDTTPDAAALRQALAAVAGAQVIEIGAELKRTYAHYLRQAQTQALLGALAVVALIALTLRSPRRVLAVCQPLLLSVLLTMGVLALFGVNFGILHLVGLLLVVAVGSNYALFFDMLWREAGSNDATEDAIDEDTLASLLLANLTTVLSFGLLALSSIPALAAIGSVVAIGALLALLLSAAFAPRRVAAVQRG